MKTIKWFKGIFSGFIGLIFTFAGIGNAENKKNQNSVTPPSEEEIIPSNFTKEELIESLKNMNRKPEEIKIDCAMCYFWTESTDDIEFNCDKCGNTNIHKRDSLYGVFTNRLPYIKRSLTAMPYKITFDSSGLCKKCGSNKRLFMNVSCFKCEKEFSVEIKSNEDIEKLSFLFLKPPIKRLDFAPWETEYTPEDIAKYISEHVFCLECRESIQIDKKD